MIGFPILKKSEHALGLEVPLNMMAGLTGTIRATVFNGKVCLKGFSTMLVAMKLVGDLLVWHYIFNSKCDQISYLDPALDDACDMNLLQLDNVRHAVGWCPNCLYCAGKYLRKSAVKWL